MEINQNLTDQTTTFRGIDAPNDTALVNKMRNMCKNVKNVKNVRNFKKINLGHWNVRTTNDSIESVRPEHVTAIICSEIDAAGIDICALSEVRRPGTGNVIEKNHTIFWSGGEHKQAGVGFAISNRLLAQSEMNPNPVNDRIMTLRIQPVSGSYLRLISVYGPTMQRLQEEKERFYDTLADCLDKAKDDNIIILGNLNARVGNDWSSWSTVLGKHGVGNMNSNGLMLREFCSRYQLTVMGTMFQLKNIFKNTWQHLRSKHWHQIDHILANRSAKQNITVTKVCPTADCFTDHKLLICKCNFRISKMKKGTKPPKKLDTHMSNEKKQMLNQYLDEKLPECTVNWE